MRPRELLQKAGNFYRRRPGWALFFLFVATSLASRGFLIGVDILDVDEAMHIVGSWEFLRGKHLYVGFVDNKPPLLYLYYAFAQLLFGRGMFAIHLLSVVVTIPLTALGVSAFFGHDRRGALAGMAFLVFGASYLAHDMHSVNCEMLMLLPATWAVAVLADEARARRLAWLFFSGGLLGIAMLFKQQALATDLREFTRTAGLVPEAKALRRFLDEPDAMLADLRPRVADMAVERARQFARRGQLARALAEIGHATAYVPSHAGADKLLRRLSASRIAIKIAVVAAGLLAALGIVLAAKPLLTPNVPAPVAPIASPVASPIASPAGTTPAPVRKAQAVAPPTAPAPTTSAASAKSRASRRTHAAVNAPATSVAESTPVSALPPQPAAPAIAPAVAFAPSPKREAEQTRAGTIALFAKGGFCYPSLDDHPAGDLMPVFRDIAPGKHRIYCSRTKQSPRELVGEVDLVPGTRIERTVTEQDGRFILARPR